MKLKNENEYFLLLSLTRKKFHAGENIVLDCSFSEVGI
jgi:hypothetical protein